MPRELETHTILTTICKTQTLKFLGVKLWFFQKLCTDGRAGPYKRRIKDKGVTEDEMVGWHHRLNGQKFEQTQGESEGQGSLVCCRPWGHKESDMTEQLNNKYPFYICGESISLSDMI